MTSSATRSARVRLRTTAIAGLAVVALALTACGGDDGGDAAGADSCAALADEGIELVQGVLDELEGMSLADLAAAGDEDPEFIQDMEEKGEALDARQSELGCSDEEMEELFLARLDDLDVEPGSIGSFLVDTLRSEGFDFGG